MSIFYVFYITGANCLFCFVLVLIFLTSIVGMSSNWVEYANTITSRIIKLNEQIYDHGKEHKHIRKLFSRIKSSTPRCSKCEGYGHETHQCPNWNTRAMTDQDLKDECKYLKEVEQKALQMLEKLEKAKQKKEKKEKEEEEKKGREEKERKEKEMLEKPRKEEEPLITLPTSMIENESLKVECKTLNFYSHLILDFNFSLKKLLTCLLLFCCLGKTYIPMSIGKNNLEKKRR